MNSFNTISYNNGTLTINGTDYSIQASGNNASGNSFSEIKLENNKLLIDGTEITLTQYIEYIQDRNGNQLQDSSGNNLVFMGE